MANAPAQPPREYSLRIGYREYKTCAKALMRVQWKVWLSGSVSWGVCTALVTAMAYFMASWYAEHNGPGAGLAVALGVGFAVGLLSPVVSALQRIDRYVDPSDGLITCELTDEAWSFRRPSGVLTLIPWRAMELLGEHPDGWLIRYDQTSLIVFRGALKAAGFDDEFRERLQGAARVSRGSP